MKIFFLINFVVQILLENDPSLVNLPNNHFQHALHYAVMRGHKDCAETLIKMGARLDLADEKVKKKKWFRFLY